MRLFGKVAGAPLIGVLAVVLAAGAPHAEAQPAEALGTEPVAVGRVAVGPLEVGRLAAPGYPLPVGAAVEGSELRVEGESAWGGISARSSGGVEGSELRVEGESGTAVNQGPPVAVETPLGLVVSKPGVSAGYVLFTNGSAGTFLIDNTGQVAHQWEHSLVNARLLPNGNVIGKQDKYLYEMDAAAKPVWEYEPPLPMHHDYLKLPNGNVLLLLTRRRSAEEVIAAGANPAFVDADRGLVHDVLVEVRPTYPVGGEIVWEWSVWDHLIQDFDPDKANYGNVAAHPERVDLNYGLDALSTTDKQPDTTDWLHANALDYHPELDQVLISARNFSELWVIDHSTTRKEAAGRKGGRSGRGGDLLYRWGNPRTYRAGTTAEQQLFWPHSGHWIPPGKPGAGNILVFSNGDEFEGFERNYSTVVEFEYPLAEAPAGRGQRKGDVPAIKLEPGEAFAPERPVWAYVGDPPSSFFSQRTSSVQRLANGNTLVLAGMQGTMFEVTPAGETVWQYVSPLDASIALAQGSRMGLVPRRERLVWANMLFRVRKYAPDHPGLQGLDLSPKGTLEQPPGQDAVRIAAGHFE